VDAESGVNRTNVVLSITEWLHRASGVGPAGGTSGGHVMTPSLPLGKDPDRERKREEVDEKREGEFDMVLKKVLGLLYKVILYNMEDTHLTGLSL
jgi:hypothetical protein